MAEKDFIVEKQRIITAIKEIDRKLAEIKDDDTDGPLADEEFIEKASYFIMVSKLLEDRFVDYEKYIRQIDPSIPRSFVKSVIESISVTEGRVTAITFKNGMTTHLHLARRIKKAQGHARLWAFIRQYTIESAYRFCAISYTSVNECKQDPLILASSVLDKECREGRNA